MRAGRTFLAVLGTALVISALWVGIACLTADSPLDIALVPAIIGVIALVGLLVGAPLLSRFVEAQEVAGRIEVRYVLRARRVIPVPDIDEVVLVRTLRLSSWSGRPSSAPRVVLRRGGRTVEHGHMERIGDDFFEVVVILDLVPNPILGCLAGRERHTGQNYWLRDTHVSASSHVHPGNVPSR
ncbi:hypothetical protein [Brevibacterium salitolerans]|uniref:PH domain-containing protein n=1 Tax=Brevibacterium salitolerans TaxID=1403566 RepID=A0ABN2WCW4_9MICO